MIQRTRPTGSMAAHLIPAYVDPDVGDEHRLVRLLVGKNAIVFREWTDFLSRCLGSAEPAACLILTLQGLSWDNLMRLRASNPRLPLMLITAYSRQNMKAVARVAFDDFVLLDELTEAELAMRLGTLGWRSTMLQAAAALRDHTCAGDPELATTLARACAAPTFISSVGEMAMLMGYSASQLERRWNRCMPPATRPHHFIAWLRVMHSLMIRSHVRSSWSDVARTLNVQQRTLATNAQNLFGMTLSQLESLYQAELINSLLQLVGAPRLDAPQSFLAR
jgi:hypothetical protein